MLLREDMVDFEPGSVVDSAGAVFYWDDGVFRAINRDYVDLYRQVLNSDYAADLFSAGLVHTTISAVSLEGYHMCLEHKKVRFVSVWKEWCSSMIKDAALMVLRLNLELAKRGLITKDIQPGNVVFDISDGPKPIWVDFGSIVQLELPRRQFPLDAFHAHWLVPLWLLSRGYHDMGRLVFLEQRREQGIKRLLSKRPFRWVPPAYYMIRRRRARLSTVDLLERLIAFVEGLSVAPPRTSWTDYGQGGMPPVDEEEEFSPKARAVDTMLARHAPGTVLDVACNKGWFAQLAASMGSQVVGFDTDDASISHLYERSKEAKLRILPLVMDFCWPTAPFGLGISKAAATERLRCDTTLVLALVHHLVFKQGLRFDTIARIIHLFSGQRAIVEFVPRDDRYVREWLRPEHDWYTTDRFLRSLGRHFSHIEVHESFPKPRMLVLCEN
jgi:SAM-dependent methyltransferase